MARLGRWRAGYPGVSCPRCHRPLRHETLQSGQQACPACNGLFEAVRFDPVEPRKILPEIAGVGPEGAAPCARHARNQAEAACARCGQFMCALCKIEAEGKVFCSSCFERLSVDGSLASGVTRLWNWPALAGTCLLASVFLWFTFVAPAFGWMVGIFFCVMGFKDKKSRNERDGHFTLYALLCINILVGIGVIAGGVAMFGALRR
jgi:hypothetical protein